MPSETEVLEAEVIELGYENEVLKERVEALEAQAQQRWADWGRRTQVDNVRRRRWKLQALQFDWLEGRSDDEIEQIITDVLENK